MSKVIKCINAENYKVTVDREYEVGAESRDFYTIINDNGIGVRYAKRLFEVISENGELVNPPAPPTPPRRTNRQVIDSIRLNNNIIEFEDFENNYQSINISNRLPIRDSNISCGVKECNGINAMIQVIDEKFDLEEDDFIEVRQALFRKSLEWAKDLFRGIFLLLSTNVSGVDSGHEADEDMLAVLDEIAYSTTEAARNPNSGRDIKVWILKKD